MLPPPNGRLYMLIHVYPQDFTRIGIYSHLGFFEWFSSVLECF